MSKAAQRGGAAGSKDGDICPVCKSSRYLNPNMKFLVNPECYHKMCSSCVDRIFSHGPAPCPIAGCKFTLRKNRFRKQTFEDLKVEREVDIRRRVASVLNKEEKDFESLRDWNDYLEVVETTTWNLILGIDVEETNRKLKAWEDAQRAERNSSTNKPSALQGDPSATEGHVVLKKGATQRKAQAHAVNPNNGTVSGAATGTQGNTPEPTAQTQDPAAKKADIGFTFHGLKKYEPPKVKPFDPYGGYDYVHQYYTLQPQYNVQWMNDASDKAVGNGGGWEVEDWYDCVMFEAFSGLGVFVGDEVEAKEDLRNVSGDAGIGTKRAQQAAKAPPMGTMQKGVDVVMDDVF